MDSIRGSFFKAMREGRRGGGGRRKGEGRAGWVEWIASGGSFFKAMKTKCSERYEQIRNTLIQFLTLETIHTTMQSPGY